MPAAPLPSAHRLSRLLLCCCLLVSALMLQPARAQPLPFQVGVPTTIPLQLTLPFTETFADLAAVAPDAVVFSTADPGEIALLNSIGLPNPVTIQSLATKFPAGAITIDTFTFANDPASPRFTVSPACTTLTPTLCTFQLSFSGAAPAGSGTFDLFINPTHVTISGAGTLGAIANSLEASFVTELQGNFFPTDYVVAPGDQNIAVILVHQITVHGSASLVASQAGASGNPVTWASLTPATCTVAGNTVTGVAVGTCTVQASQAGNADYNAATPVPQTIQVVADPNAPRLGAISTRMQVLTGDNVLIGGFIISGSTPKTVVVRARGPSLASAGITNFLANPQLQLVFGNGTVVTNDDWQTEANAVAILSSGFAPSNSNESAILITLDPGPYTAIVSGAGGGTGVGLVEVFEVDHPENPMAGISTRGFVSTGDSVMIGGIIIQGDAPQTVVVRARGPSLAAQGVANPLANPLLQLVAADGTVFTNDDWQSAANAAQITASGFAPVDPRESAILVTLNPGAYTAIVSGVGGATGVGIVEAFVVP